MHTFLLRISQQKQNFIFYFIWVISDFLLLIYIDDIDECIPTLVIVVFMLHPGLTDGSRISLEQLIVDLLHQ